MNVIARDPTAASLRYVIGGDTAGLLVSQDDGTSWTAANAGLQDLSQTTIASVAFQDPPKDGEVYAAYGTAFATNSGLLHSADGGLTWTPVAATGTVLPIFNGGHSGGYPAYQVGASPRATGALLALDDHGGIPRHIYAGTFGQGVIRSDDGGLTWTRIALGSDETNPHCTFTTNNGTDHGCFVTGLLLSGIRGERDTLYVAVHGGDASTCVGDGICGGVFKVTKAACSGDGCADATTSRIAGTPVDPSNAEELTMVRGVLLCACGTDGFYAKGPHGPMLVQRNTNLAFDQSIQTCTSVVYVGTGPWTATPPRPRCTRPRPPGRSAT